MYFEEKLVILNIQIDIIKDRKMDSSCGAWGW